MCYLLCPHDNVHVAGDFNPLPVGGNAFLTTAPSVGKKVRFSSAGFHQWHLEGRLIGRQPKGENGLIG